MSGQVRRLRPIEDFVLDAFAMITWHLDTIKVPVKVYAVPVFDLLGGHLNDGGGEQAQGP